MMIFNDIFTQKNGLALSFREIIINRPVLFDAVGRIIAPVLFPFCRKNRMFNGKNKVAAFNQTAVYFLIQAGKIFNIVKSQ